MDTVGLVGAAMVMESDFAADVPAVFLAVTVKVKLPAVVGVPEMTPVLVFRLSPPGRLPDAFAQVMVPPPVAARVWE